MNIIASFFDEHYDFIKWQSECYALSVSFFSVSILCFRYLEKLLYALGAISGVCLGVIAVGLILAAVGKAQTYFGEKIVPKGSIRHLALGFTYVSTAVCAAFTIIFKVVLA